MTYYPGDYLGFRAEIEAKKAAGKDPFPFWLRASFWAKFAVFVLCMNIPVIGIFVAVGALYIMHKVDNPEMEEVQEEQEECQEESKPIEYEPVDFRTAEQMRSDAIKTRSYLDAHKKLNERYAA